MQLKSISQDVNTVLFSKLLFLYNLVNIKDLKNLEYIIFFVSFTYKSLIQRYFTLQSFFYFLDYLFNFLVIK